MATRSMIGVQRENGTIEAIYCHWDGYMAHHGPILLEAYNGPRKIEALIRQGDLSSLGRRLVKDTFILDDDDFCSVAAGGNHAAVYDDIHDLRERQDWCEYFYIYGFGRWWVTTCDETDHLRTLEGWFKPEELLTNPV